jgi:beta-glucuronidase
MRLFDRHLVRPTRDLGGQWDFVAEPDVRQRDAYGLPTAFPDRVHVPGCWENHPRLRSYRGIGWFRRNLVQPEAGTLRLLFEGASHTARVFLDRNEVAGHYNAYTAFEVALPEVDAGQHELLVEVDNTFGDHSALHKENDYYTYGGLVRPVTAEFPAPQYVRFLHVTPRLAAGKCAAKLRVQVVNLANAPARVRAAVECAGLTVDLGPADVPPGGDAWIETDADCPDARPWSPDAPNLYLCRAVLYPADSEQPVDDLVERVGFREVTTRGTEILLNGEPVRLRGFNRHEDHPMFGCALPVEAMVLDLDRIQHLGANCVRTSHYPNDERFLDLCDERGLLVWEENHARGLSLEHMQHPLFREQALACTREMVEQHFCHPAIVLWGILNECASFTEEGRDIYAEEFQLLKRLDTSRPTTFASCHGFKDLCLDLPDVVGFNIYTGWYRDPSSAVRERIDAVIGWIEKAGGGGKPLIISEFGGGARAGHRGRHKYSEDYQAKLYRRQLAAMRKSKGIAGLTPWILFDFRCPNRQNTHQRGFNVKGLVDADRKTRKLAFEVYAKFKPPGPVTGQ